MVDHGSITGIAFPKPTGQTAMSFTELASFLQAQTEPHILFDTRYRIIAVNQAFRKYCNPQTSVIGRTCYAVSHNYDMPCDRSGETCPLAKSRRSGKMERVLHMHHTPNGEEYVSIELTPVKNESGEITCFVEKIEPVKMAKGITERNSLQGQSPRFAHMMHQIGKAASADISILLYGESGTGKELVAQAIHRAGKRAAKPFIVVDCSGISEAHFETELFGQEKGAFSRTGSAKKGLVDAADGGTLFLDEVGDLPLSMQSKLLRLLETGAYRRPGSADPRRADIRIISATSHDLKQKADAGLFRKDLYYRLDIFPIHVPALRDRLEDIPLLVTSLLKKMAPERNLNVSDEAMYLLQTYPYPGNVRELRNFLERACLLCDDNEIKPEHLMIPENIASGNIFTPSDTLPEQTRLKQILATFRGNRKKLATMLGISERTLYRRLSELNDTSADKESGQD